MRLIPLTQGYVAMVDDEDYDSLMQHCWYAAVKPEPYTAYAVRDIRVDGKKKTVHMHRVINGTPDGLVTDHINGNGLDNRRANLRSVTHQDNLLNQKCHKQWASKHRGVSWHSGNNRWIAQIKIDGKNTWIGSFRTEEEAAAASAKRRAEVRAGKITREDAA